jgi:hypothetical protein
MTKLFKRIAETFHPDAAPPTSEESGSERGGARGPQAGWPRTFAGQAEGSANEKTDHGSENHQSFHLFSGRLAEGLPLLPPMHGSRGNANVYR